MQQQYTYEEKGLPFTQSSFQVPQVPDLRTPTVYIFGNKDENGSSQLVTVDLDSKTPTQTIKIEKSYSQGLIYNPPTDTLFQPNDGTLLVHNLVKNEVVRIKHGKPSTATGIPFKCISRVCGDLTLLLNDQHLVMVNTKNLEFSKLDLGEKGYENLDFTHTGGSTIAVLARNLSERTDGIVRVYDIIKKELICMFKMEFKGNSASAISPKIFFNYATKQGIVYRGAESAGGEEQLIGISTFDPKTKAVSSQAFKLKAASYDKPSMVSYSGKSSSLYVGTVTGKLFQVCLQQEGFVGGLGTYNNLQSICTHPLWDGVLLIFKPENGILRLGFVAN